LAPIIQADDIDVTLRRIEEAGRRTAIGEIRISDGFGCFARSHGNPGDRLGLWTPSRKESS